MTHFPPRDDEWLHDSLIPDAHKRVLRRVLYPNGFGNPPEVDVMKAKIEAAMALAKVYGVSVARAACVDTVVYLRTQSGRYFGVVMAPKNSTGEIPAILFREHLTIGTTDITRLAEAGFFA